MASVVSSRWANYPEGCMIQVERGVLQATAPLGAKGLDPVGSHVLQEG